MRRSIVAALIAILLVSLTAGPARSGGGPDFSLDKTVGIGPVCATASMLTVVQGTPVTYCYTGRNLTAGLTFLTHTIVDSVLGSFPSFVNPIGPGGSLSVSTSFTPCLSVTNVATWTAQISGSFAARRATDTATVTVEEPAPSLLLTKTVAADGSCPGVAQDVVLAGANVTYCYEVGNNGNVLLTVHALVDSELGVIMISPTSLAPGSETPVATRMAIINEDTVNDATATATFTVTCEDQTTVTSLRASDSAEVLVADPTPALDYAGLVVAALILMAIGGLSLSLRRRIQ